MITPYEDLLTLEKFRFRFSSRIYEFKSTQLYKLEPKNANPIKMMTHDSFIQSITRNLISDSLVDSNIKVIETNKSKVKVKLLQIYLF